MYVNGYQYGRVQGRAAAPGGARPLLPLRNHARFFFFITLGRVD